MSSKELIKRHDEVIKIIIKNFHEDVLARVQDCIENEDESFLITSDINEKWIAVYITITNKETHVLTFSIKNNQELIDDNIVCDDVAIDSETLAPISILSNYDLEQIAKAEVITDLDVDYFSDLHREFFEKKYYDTINN